MVIKIIIVPSTPEPECRVDQDCPSKLACIDERCQNPCQINNPCTGNQRCVVSDTLPTRTVACVCPEGTVFSDRGNCQEGNERHQNYLIFDKIVYDPNLKAMS